MSDNFNKQLRQEEQLDELSMEEALGSMASIIMGESAMAEALGTGNRRSRDAVERIMAYHGCTAVWPQDTEMDMKDQIEFVLRPHGIMTRRVVLDGKWWHTAYGTMLGRTDSGEPVAILPTVFGGLSGFLKISMKRNGSPARGRKK